MKPIDELIDMAAARKGGREAMLALIEKPKSKAALKKIPDDRWLSDMSRRVFQAGFNWSVVDKKWDGFEDAFDGFSPARWAHMSDDDLDTLLKDARIVRHATKIQSVRDNAKFVLDLSKEHGSAGAFFADHPKTAYVDLLTVMKKNGARLGGATAQYFLRGMGVDSVIFTDHVVKALIREKIVDKAPSSQRDLAKCQDAFNIWLGQSKVTLNQISRVLAFTVDG